MILTDDHDPKNVKVLEGGPKIGVTKNPQPAQRESNPFTLFLTYLFGAISGIFGFESAGPVGAASSFTFGFFSGNYSAQGYQDAGNAPTGNLEKWPKGKRTAPESPAIKHKQLVPTPEGMSDEQFRKGSEEQFNKYEDNVPYSATGRSGANSNSIIFSTLRAKGANVKPDKWVPGHDVDIPYKKDDPPKVKKTK
ncbi:hypothetical protein EHQ27_05915 [Leptospira wolffii]|uniref:hypothetical protein n=1 Tax=Leptospira wolffii TaxID=409998 RepID=UPI0010843A9B|nr:hypothetical protein [Leptospira wolffii]TGK61515.1 hypothetical protein EHQ32_01240 [Leptospira wolffii]TGK70059.1 hypothetical protein EHQ35_16655 [Leptospira wolffii]TGK74990.1 hypothetical protein EHQ27_05915 [Leptospira wolffii]TGL31166.1 hypothetical protein EHQ57_07155 [Leptospira wolffii]